MSTELSIAELDDDPETVYLFGTPHLTEGETAEFARAISDRFLEARCLVINSDLDDDVTIREIDADTLEEVLTDGG